MSPLDGPAQPRPKSASLARGAKRYRRFVASPKQWQAIHAAKAGPCRVCPPASNGHVQRWTFLHHVVARDHGGDDYAQNIVPVCHRHHELIHVRDRATCAALLDSLTAAEYGYAVQRGGSDYFERAYGVRYSR